MGQKAVIINSFLGPSVSFLQDFPRYLIQGNAYSLLALERGRILLERQR